ncbi:DUF6456 domain-containing protein [Paracoccus aeridis]|uniref:DUF6456 domain-containing protein n=1 Tax=Paracoccus aeridis TaxID=1966466 RepID=UPI0010AAFAB3
MTILTADFSVCAAIATLPELGRIGVDAAGTAGHLTNLTPAGTAMPAPRPAALPAAMPDDARLYLRHVEGGESIRAIARDTGCHASTILRRIRRFEQRRDDPLLDGAVDRSRATPQGLDTQAGRGSDWTRNELDQARRILRRLAEPRAVMAVAAGMEKAIVMRDDIRLAVLDRALAERMALMGWVALSQSGRITRHVITPAGRAALKNLVAARGRTLPGFDDFTDAQPVQPETAGQGAVPEHGFAEGPAPFDHAEQHRVWADREIEDPETGERRRARVNLAESPLLVLARRRGADGKPFLDAGLVGAGERLREDFELAQMGARVTQNWDRFMTAGIDSSPHAGGRHGGGSEGARDRVAAALRDLGPGMGDLVLRVCCFLEGIEMTERRLGWSARSGKIVLRLALMRLERHYQERYGSGSPLIG